MKNVEAAAGQLVANRLLTIMPSQRSAWLRSVIAHAAAGLVVIDGHREASEHLYRIADAAVAQDGER